MNADTAYQSPHTALEDVKDRVEQIRNHAVEDQVDKSRKVLLELIQDYDSEIPNHIRAAVFTRSREFIEISHGFSAGFGDEQKYNKNTFELLHLAEQVLDHFTSQPEQPVAAGPTKAPFQGHHSA